MYIVCVRAYNVYAMHFYTIYSEKYFSERQFSYNNYYSPCHYMRTWIRVLDAPGCYEKVRTTRLRIGQNCRAVCTKSSAYVQLARDAFNLLNNRHENAVCLLSRRWR